MGKKKRTRSGLVSTRAASILTVSSILGLLTFTGAFITGLESDWSVLGAMCTAVPAGVIVLLTGAAAMHSIISD